jgi:hypothetical protein
VLSRTAIAHHISDAFDQTPVTRAALLRHAGARHAPPEVVRAIESLPNEPYKTMSQLWKHLPDVPVEA